MNTPQSVNLIDVQGRDLPGRRAASQRADRRSNKSVDSGTTVRIATTSAHWTVCESFAAAFDDFPDDLLIDPEKAGWELIKQNAERDVWRGRLGGLDCHLKRYRDRLRHRLLRWRRGSPAEREWRAGMYAQRHGVAVVEPIAFCDAVRVGPRRGPALLTRTCEPVTPLFKFWSLLASDAASGRKRADRHRLIDQVAALVARMHQAGFQHLDLHAGNLLIHTEGPRTYQPLLVDVQSARLDRPVSDAAVVRNLAQLNQWFARHSAVADRLRFLRAYLRWRLEYEDQLPHSRRLGVSFEALTAAMQREAWRQAQRVWTKRDRRTGRRGKYLDRLRLGGGWSARVFVECKRAVIDSVATRSPRERAWWRAQLTRPTEWMARVATANLKNSHSAQVAFEELHADETRIPVVLKRPLGRNLWRRVRMRFGRSRALRAWRRGHALLHREIPTAMPLAVLEHRVGPVLLDELLIVERLENALPLREHLRVESSERSPIAWRRQRVALRTELARQLRTFVDRGCEHHDCKADNLLILSGRAPRVVWIDLDGVRIRSTPTPRDAIVRMLARLFVSLAEEPAVARTDALYVLKRMTQRFGAPRDAWRSWWREIAAGVAQKSAQREQRAAWKRKHYGRV